MHRPCAIPFGVGIAVQSITHFCVLVADNGQGSTLVEFDQVIIIQPVVCHQHFVLIQVWQLLLDIFWFKIGLACPHQLAKDFPLDSIKIVVLIPFVFNP